MLKQYTIPELYLGPYVEHLVSLAMASRGYPQSMHSKAAVEVVLAAVKGDYEDADEKCIAAFEKAFNLTNIKGDPEDEAYALARTVDNLYREANVDAYSGSISMRLLAYVLKKLDFLSFALNRNRNTLWNVRRFVASVKLYGDITEHDRNLAGAIFKLTPKDINEIVDEMEAFPHYFMPGDTVRWSGNCEIYPFVVQELSNNGHIYLAVKDADTEDNDVIEVDERECTLEADGVVADDALLREMESHRHDTHPKRGELLGLLADNGMDGDDAHAVADAILDLLCEDTAADAMAHVARIVGVMADKSQRKGREAAADYDKGYCNGYEQACLDILRKVEKSD